MVEGTCEDTKSRVLCEPGVSGESKVIVDLTRGSVLVPDKQKELYRRHTLDIIERRHFQQTSTESKFGEDGSNVVGHRRKEL